MTVNYLRTVLWVVLVMLWTPAVALAATMQNTLDGVSPRVLATVAILSTLSGATALVLRIDKELRGMEPGTKLPRPVLFASAHMLGSWLAGVLGFFIAEGQKIDGWLGFVVIVTMSFVGAKAIEMVAEKYLASALPGTPNDRGPTP